MVASSNSATQGIRVTETARVHLEQLCQQQGSELLLRVGISQGGCSGLSYKMDFETPDQVQPERDDVFDYDGFRIVCDRKSLLYLYGLELDYSNALIGGGFQFTNPNANQTCGCGKSFGV
ncbi:MAG: iron-sulfur cluster assembly accessory protein [Cyanobacteria bacterium P01_H01_bin.15]